MLTYTFKPMRFRTLGAVLALSVAISGPLATVAQAATTVTTTFTVTASVLQTCLVAATPLAFGNYDPTSATPTDGSTTVLVTCTNATPYNVGLNAGTGTGASVATRKMTNGANTLNYSLYSNAARSTVWGNTISTDTVSGTGTGLPVSYTVYGRIPALQSAVQGAYTDTITVSVTY